MIASLVSARALTQTFSDGFPCAGAIELSVTYAGFGVNSGVYYNYAGTGAPGVQNWTGRTRLHMWIKLVTSDYTRLQGVEHILHSANFTLSRYTFLTASAFASQGANRGWFELVVDLTPQIPDAGTTGFDPTSVDEIEVQLQSGPGPQVDGGPAAPSPTTLFVDSIWLE